MNTPILDFIQRYMNSLPVRFHMPGHKGREYLGFEAFDITEINGADVLSHAEGIIKESEDNATALFGSGQSFYSAEGSTLAIKAMLSLAVTASGEERPLVLAARNAHKAFLYAAAWLDFDVKWLMPQDTSRKERHLCACPLTVADVAEALSACEKKPCALYLTSPDYLGNIADIAGIAALCQKEKIPLLVDNAHGAYLRFMKNDLHPISLGATACCDSAHKTLPVLTGGAYLHIAQDADPYFVENARTAMASFASTSPSYLILASLDACNRYLSEKGKRAFDFAAGKVAILKKRLESFGFTVCGDEPLKVTLYAPDSGYTGDALAARLREEGVECEFSDREYLVLMASPQNYDSDFSRADEVFAKLAKEKKEPFSISAPPFTLPPVAMTPRQAILKKSELLPIDKALGRIAATPTVSCPPAVPIVVSGEEITKEATMLFKHYGIDTVSVVKP